MRGSLRKMKPLHPPEAFQPPPGAEPYGVVDGKQLYRLVRKRSKPVPRFVDTPEVQQREAELKAQGKNLEEIGEIMLAEGFQRQFRKNQNTGEPMYPMNRSMVYDEVKIFYMESEGNGNGKMVDYAPPTEQELAERERAQQVAQMRDDLPRLLVEKGVTVEDILDATKQRGAPTQTSEADEDAEDENPESEEYPVHLGFGNWQLSDGSRIKGKKEEAVEAEQAAAERIAEAKAESALVPEL